jgi:DNA transformation protein
MPVSAQTQETVRWCSELLGALGQVRAKRMFGGHGVYVDEVFIAVIVGEDLFLKVDDVSRPVFEAAGCRPVEFQTADGKKVAMSYWSAPAEAMDSPEQMLPWARQALASALRAKASKPPAKPRAPRAKLPAAAATKPPRKGSGQA